MGLQIRDDRQMKALTGLSQDQFDHLLPVFSDMYQGSQQKTYELDAQVFLVLTFHQGESGSCVDRSSSR